MTQSIQELSGRVIKIAEIFNFFLSDPTAWGALNDESRQVIITGINKSFGQALGCLHEYQTSQTGRAKARPIETQLKGDVTIGHADALYAKTIECKSATAPTKGDVNALIRKAFQQLAGMTGHQPRTDDVRVVDVKIDGPYNPWPISGGQYGVSRSAQNLNDIVTNAESTINELLNETAASPLKNWLLGDPSIGKQLSRLGDINFINPSIQNPQPIRPHPNSSRPVYIENQQVNKVRCLTIKIRFENFYPLTTTSPNEFLSLSHLTLQAYRNQMIPNTQTPSLIAKVAKHFTYSTVIPTLPNQAPQFNAYRTISTI